MKVKSGFLALIFEIFAPMMVIAQGNGFVRIPGGSFMMGTPKCEDTRITVGYPQHSVTVNAFYIGKCEVTQAEWKAVMGNNPSCFQGEMLPVECVSWYDALVYCNKRSIKEGLKPSYSIDGRTNPVLWGEVPTIIDSTWDAVICDFTANGYRLPTEAEWEYACRAGTTTPFNTGDNITTSQANYDGNHPYYGNVIGESRGKTMQVGSFEPNGYGLFDMHGNVWEWCWDWQVDYTIDSQTNPIGPDSGTGRVLRGGFFMAHAECLRSDFRISIDPHDGLDSTGFRLVVSAQ